MKSGTLFLSCDWGTSRLRLRLVSVEPARIVAEVASEDGAARIHRAVLRDREGRDGPPPHGGESLGEERARRFETTLLERIAQLERRSGQRLESLPVVVSGMASSSIGWRELPYGALPLNLDGTSLTTLRLPPIGPGRHEVILVSGVRTEADILRGEEVEALGILNAEPYRELAEDVVLILPGTHSKHIRVVGGQITTFETFMTGELYEVMARNSILRNSVDPDSLEAPWWEISSGLSEVFRDAARAIQGRVLSGALFSVRARQVLEQRSAEWCAAYLNGLLVGAELTGAASAADTGTRILIGASRSLGTPYRLACAALGLGRHVTFCAEEEMARAVVIGQRMVLGR